MSLPLLEKKPIRNVYRRYGLLATYSCVRAATKCVHGARQRCSRGAVGYLNALLRRPRRSNCAATAILRCSYCAHVTTPSILKVAPLRGNRGDHTAPNGDATRCSCALGDPLRASRRSAFFLDAARTP